MGVIWIILMGYGWNMGGIWVEWSRRNYQYHKKWKISDFLNLFFDIVKSQVKFDQTGLDWNGMDENGLEWMENGTMYYFQHMEGHL